MATTSPTIIVTAKQEEIAMAEGEAHDVVTGDGYADETG